MGSTTSNNSFLDQHRIKGILLYGPPGTGKTHLSRAIAKESGATMLSVDSATLVNKYIGEKEKHIKAAFSLASRLSPCLIFLDEVDALFYDRRTAEKSWERSAITQFLLELDGLVNNDKAPFVIVATNRPWDLDAAFLRRLPQKVPMMLPDVEARSKILKVIVKSEDLDPLVDIEALARETDGCSGSDLRNLCSETALMWAIEQSKKRRGKEISSLDFEKMRLNSKHFTKALQKIRPSVSKECLLEFEEFINRFNPPLNQVWF
ncbi:AAA-domain-containing protein [Mollisia scopiformis]|uniref:AAA-domain-containing protein n=1 Tax=Mollisia scopiformis TaxID=149040 RepID=A0A132B9C2_MOLSC|nr:AAA-domain-containing protein [Mollisia scopiformis]KUJ08853.1 AAA-domain-containing protein [Mollisia scopiformis]